MKDKVLCDTDIISALAKADALDFLPLVFPDRKFLVTEYVRDELDVSKQEGFDFPKKVFEFCETTTMDENELKIYEAIDSLEISKTDLKNLVIAKNRDIPLLTNDSKLYSEGVRRDIKVYDLRELLRAIYEEDLVSKKELKKVIEKIEEKDNTHIKKKREIFKK
ncbi:MAG: hypothetical protein KGY76_09990 [Candidatus Thermoplasmatota archaeon]|nr:hypothetical protein [Candidatus Thermoplasmatota archaeon]